MRIQAGMQAADLLEYENAYRAASPLFAGLLLDAFVDGYGGGGKVFDWTLIPEELAPRVVLSGGLSVHNATDAVLRVRPYSVDVSIGVEAVQGHQGCRQNSRLYQRGARGGCNPPMSTTMNIVPPITLPDAKGHFGPYGGSFVSETLTRALTELKQAYAKYGNDAKFQAEFHDELNHFVGRPSPIYHAKRWSEIAGGAQIYFKREDLNHTGAHKINNVIGQALLAKRMGKPRVIAETGAGQHGVATATICARYGLECVVYMGSEDVKRQVQNVYRMELLGAKVVPVESGSKTLKDALNEAMRDWVTNVENTFYIIGTVAGPHPYPMMVRDFQSVIGEECLQQMPEMTGRQPDYVVACIGGGSNAMGIFYPYIDYPEVQLIGVEAAGDGLETGQTFGLAAGRFARRAARQSHLFAAGCERAGHRNAFGFGRSRLPGCWP